MSTATKPTAEDRFDNLITFLIATVTILVAFTAYLQNDASSRSDVANRHAQELAIQSTTEHVTGAIQYSYEWEGAFQTWTELDLQITTAENAGDQAAADRFRKVRERIETLSPLFGDYYDSEIAYPKLSQFEVDLHVLESTRLTELYKAEARVGQAWNDVADHYVIQITLLTVALSLYGLSLTLKTRVRWLFVTLGTGIVGVCILWLGVEMIWPKPVVNRDAIEAYSQGVGLAYVGDYDQSITSFHMAIEKDPSYANAFHELGNSYYNQGDYVRAAENYEAAMQAGRDDTTVLWNLGWTYYLLGRYDEALAINSQILETSEEVIGVRANQGLLRLAMGDLQGARQEYDILIAEAEKQVTTARAAGEEPSAALWYYMDVSAIDLQNLIDQLDNNPRDWTQAPTADLVMGEHSAIKEEAQFELMRLKNATMSLDYTGALPESPTEFQMPVFVFGNPTYDEEGFVTEFEELPDAVFPSDTDPITVYFEYSGPLPATPLIWKFYRNGYEVAGLQEVWDDVDLAESNAWYNFIEFPYTDVFVLADGDYTVEVYADYQLVQRGTFTIQP